MKTLRNLLFLPFLFVSMGFLVFSVILIDEDTNQAIANSEAVLTISKRVPVLVSVVDGGAVAFAWKDVAETENYRFLLSFLKGGSESAASYEIDLGLKTEFVLDFDDPKALNMFDENVYSGLTFHASVEACDRDGVCRKSNAEYFQIDVDSSGIINIQQASPDLNPNNGDIAIGNPACSYFVEPARSCVFGTDIFVPVGETNPFTASGGTGGFTMSSNNPGIVTGGFTSPAQGTGWITGISEGSTSINIWNGTGCMTPMSVTVLPALGNYVYISDVNPVPYPYSMVPAGVPITITLNMWLPPVSNRYYSFAYELGLLGGVYSNTSTGKARQIGESKIQEVEISANQGSWSQTVTISGTLPYSYDYLLIWIQYFDSDQTTLLAESCVTGWLIDNVIIN